MHEIFFRRQVTLSSSNAFFLLTFVYFQIFAKRLVENVIGKYAVSHDEFMKIDYIYSAALYKET